MTGCAAGFSSTREATMTARQWTILVAPPLLIVTMYAAFRQLTTTLGFPLGYLAAFCLYWICWCLALPIALLGPRRLVALFVTGPPFARLETTTQLLLWWPVAFPFMFAFLPRLADTDTRVIVASVALGAVIGVTEELLWRGVYVTLFADSVWLNSVYPSVAFGVWHLCPLSVLPSRYPGGAAAFAVYSIALGFSYAHSVRRTGSIRWCTVSHCIHDALGLGASAYAGWLT